MNTHSETFTLLVCNDIDDALLKVMPVMPQCHSFSEGYPLLKVDANFVICWIHAWVLEPQAWWNNPDYLTLQKSEMGDTDTESVGTHWADTLFCWKIKISYMTGSCWVEVCYCNAVRLYQLHWVKNKFWYKFLL